ncbi:Thioredoxin [compost metagenome]
MTFQDYLNYFRSIIEKSNEEQAAPYDNPDYIEYTRMNWSRMNRWLKTGKLSEELTAIIKGINEPQTWIIITEPWCGDAAHSVPFFHMLAGLNPLIHVEYELRDSAPFRINDYLTNGSKSIPKVIFRNAEGQDFASWGPRPAGCQEVYTRLTTEKADFETVKTEIQKWYNADKGVGVQVELGIKLKVKN